MTVVSDIVSLATRSCENLLNESTETFERLIESLGNLWSGGSDLGVPRPLDDEPWWTTPEEGDLRYVDVTAWEAAPAGPWGPC